MTYAIFQLLALVYACMFTYRAIRWLYIVFFSNPKIPAIDELDELIARFRREDTERDVYVKKSIDELTDL